MKILSPVGSFDSLKMAVFNGADEVYLGITDFNARAVNGFTFDQLKEVVTFSHTYGVKVLLAVNILFKDNELQKALDLVVDSYNIGVDAFIVQDFGLVNLIHNNFPQIELHASTQMGIHNLEGVKAIEKYGFKRVVLARETSLSEIKRIREGSDIEIEYFAHGALCVSFSGNCYLSSYMCDASGNRGRCKQLCRLPYKLYKGDKKLADGYLLSAKDFNMLDRIDDLKRSGVDVLKIEGRARRPFYVAMATKAYRDAIDGKKVDTQNLALAFNRGFTEGYFNGNGNIISGYNNHIGVRVGKVTKVNLGKKFNEVYFDSNRPVSKKSLLKVFVDGKEKTSFTAFDLTELSKGKYKTTTTVKVPLGDLHLVVDNGNEEEVLNTTSRVTADIFVTAIAGQKITADINCRGYHILSYGEICDEAKSNPLSENEIKDNFNKSEIFNAKIKCKLRNAFLPKQKLNEFRRNTFALIQEKLTELNFPKLQKIKIDTNCNFKKLSDISYIKTTSNDFLTKNIVFSPETYTLENAEKFIKKCKSKNATPYLDLPNFALKEDIELLKDIIGKTKIAVVANNYYALDFDTDIVIGGGLNVYNSVSASAFDRPVLCAESNISTRIKMPYMTLRHCPMKSHLNATCSSCPYSEGYYYVMENGKRLTLTRKKLSTCTFYLE